MLKVGTRFERFSDAGTQARRGYPGATPGRLLGTLVLVVGGVGLGAGQDAGVLDARRSFAPPGWEIGDCPPAYGKDSVLCAGTDTGPFKVDRHIPTMWIRAPGGGCAETEKDAVGRLAKYGMTVSRKSTGRCGPRAAPCTEIRLKDPRPTDPLAPLLYVVCPAAGPVEVVEYGVSARVIDAFEPVARVQARWQPDR